MTLLEPHRQKLLACGLTPATWERAGLHSGSPEEVRDILGYGTGAGGLVIPYSDTYSRVRIDNPGPDGKRYRSPKGGGNHLYVPKTLPADVLTDASICLHLTEGEFKALKATQDGIPTLALPGVWSWKQRLHGKSLAMPDLSMVTWKGRTVVVVFDSDLAEKPPVAWAEHALCQELRSREAHVYVVRLPDGPLGAKLGLDDYLVAYGADAFRKLPMLTIGEADKEVPTFLRVSDLADAYMLRATRPQNRLSLGYGELDEIIRGLADGETMTVLGRAAVGKTAFALNLVERMTAEGQVPTLIFSLEQPGLELFERMASMTLEWPGREIEERTRDEDPDMARRLLGVVERWHHVVVVEKPCALDQLDRLIEAARMSEMWPEPLRLVVVDYMGLIGQRGKASPYEHMSQTARELKTLAKRHRVAVLTLCQVDREGGSGGEPITLRSARDSGVIEEAADYLLGIWRPELQEGISREARDLVRGQFKVRVLKNRSGPAHKTVTLRLEPTTLRIGAVDQRSVRL